MNETKETIEAQGAEIVVQLPEGTRANPLVKMLSLEQTKQYINQGKGINQGSLGSRALADAINKAMTAENAVPLDLNNPDNWGKIGKLKVSVVLTSANLAEIKRPSLVNQDGTVTNIDLVGYQVAYNNRVYILKGNTEFQPEDIGKQFAVEVRASEINNVPSYWCAFI